VLSAKEMGDDGKSNFPLPSCIAVCQLPVVFFFFCVVGIASVDGTGLVMNGTVWRWSGLWGLFRRWWLLWWIFDGWRFENFVLRNSLVALECGMMA
jgi:hypothetical protein